MIQILQTTQIFKLTTGPPQFAYTCVLFTRAGATFQAKYLDRGDVDPDNLVDIQHIPPDSTYPPVTAASPGCRIAASPEKWHTKTPRLLSLDGGTTLAKLILRELAACEIIQKRPHRNLAAFQGCRVADGRIVGLCFTKYVGGNLQERLNPRSLNKTAFILSQDRDHVEARRRAGRCYLGQIKEAIRYMHSLDLVHNDVNPANVVLDEEDAPVIVDFDSSCAPGRELGRAKRTYGWYDPCVDMSLASNDWGAVAELQVWLSGTSPDEFQFGPY